MTTRTDITVDWASSPRVILVLAPSTELTVQDLVDTCRDLEDELDVLQYERLLDASGKEPLGGGVFVGITAALNNAVIAFEARPGPTYVQCTLSGGNVAAFDVDGFEINPIQPTAFTQVVRTSSSSATLQELSDIQYASFNGGVTIDVLSAYSGTTYPTGTPRQPVNNLGDALAIATIRGFTTFYVRGDLFVNLPSLNGFSFIGESQGKSMITIDGAAGVLDCEFYDCHLDGVLDGNAYAKNCVLDNVTYITGFVEQCVLAGNIVLGGSGTARFLDCWAGVTLPTIDCGGSGQGLVLRNYNGGLVITNKTGSDQISIDLNSGQVSLTSAVTNGTIIVRGLGNLDDQSTGAAAVDASYLLDPSLVPANVWGKVVESGLTAEELMRIVTAFASGKTGIVDLGGGVATVTFRDVADTKNRITGTMTGSERTAVTLDGA